MVEKISFQGKLIALKVHQIAPGSVPITEPAQPLQIVTLKHPKGAYLKAHMHVPKRRVTSGLQECLIIRKGRIEVDLYSSQKQFIKTIQVSSGEVLVLVKGGYGIRMLTEAEIVEVKNGPFVEDKVLI